MVQTDATGAGIDTGGRVTTDGTFDLSMAPFL